MPATKVNYVVTYENHSQVYGTAKKDTALSSPPPPGCDIDGKRVFFIAMEPDNEVLAVYQIPKLEVVEAYEAAERARLEALAEKEDQALMEEANV